MILFSSLYYKTTILCTCSFAPFTRLVNKIEFGNNGVLICKTIRKTLSAKKRGTNQMKNSIASIDID